MERGIELFVAVHGIAIGLSHLCQSQAWVEFFVRLRSWGRPGVFVNGFLSLTFGSIIVAFHNVWDGLPTVITVLGWLQVVKGSICFVFPQVSMKGLQRVSPERAREFVYAGAVLLALGLFSAWLYLRP